MKSNYLIEYKVCKKDGTVIKSGKMRVKNKTSDIEAKVMLERYFKKHIPDFGSLVVVNCFKDNNLISMFNDIFNT